MLLAGCVAGRTVVEPVTLSGPTMGTSYTVKVNELPDGLSREQLQDEIDRALETVNDQMSTYRPESELSRFNRYDGEDWFEVSPATAGVVAEAQRISEMTGGAFDATVGPLVDLWHFGPENGEKTIPAEAEIAEAKSRVGYRQIEVRPSPPALRKAVPDVQIDLSAIAKGFGVDRLCRLLEERGIADYLVEIGGEIRTRGIRPDGQPWTVGIEAPVEGQRELHKAVALGDRAMATSGGYRNFFVVDGRRYSHTIDPRTGRPVEHTLASVSVVAEDCMFADGAATALLVLGPEDGYNWAERRDLPVLMIVRAADGTLTEKATAAFEELLSGESPRPEEARSNMKLFLIALAVFAIAMTGMAVGVLLGRRALRGSCGGLANLRDEHGQVMCEICTTPSETCSGDPEDRPTEDEETVREPSVSR